jgi:hypothetical protein
MMVDISSTLADPASTSIPISGALRATRAAPAGNPAADVFAQALIDDSNHELDWLWAASQLTDIVQRRYCLERVLAINTNSELARRELTKLASKPTR